VELLESNLPWFLGSGSACSKPTMVSTSNNPKRKQNRAITFLTQEEVRGSKKPPPFRIQLYAKIGQLKGIPFWGSESANKANPIN
jgi:hypothetical protein